MWRKLSHLQVWLLMRLLLVFGVFLPFVRVCAAVPDTVAPAPLEAGRMSASLHAWRIGILAPRGPEKALSVWGPWRDWLEQRLPGEHFALVPLVPDQAAQPQLLGQLDFLLANPLQFHTLDPRRRVRWLATLKPSGHGDLRFLEQIGSAIWVRADGPHELAALRGRRVGAVHPDALGGYLLGVELLARAGLRPYQDYRPVFSGFPADRPLLQLAAGQVDAAIVPVCLAEELQAAGRLGAVRLRLLGQGTAALPGCASSTRLLPGWSLAALDTVPEDMALALSKALLGEAAAPGLPQWSLPQSAADVEQRLQRIGYVAANRDVFALMQALWWRYWPWLTALLGIALLLLGNSVWLAWLARRQHQRLRQAHERLHRHEQALVRADKAALLGEMAAGIAHEVRQPLSAILQYAEAASYRLRAEAAAHPLLPVLQQIREEVQRCNRIITQLRSWVRPGPGPRESQALKHMLAPLIDLVALQARRRCVQVTLLCSPVVDEARVPKVFEQVLANVFLNAVQAGGRHLTVQARLACGQVEMTVLDDGPGFAAEHLQFPFVPFRTTRPDGLGLGLLIAQRIMSSLNGQIRLANRVDGVAGAAVYLSLPVDCPDSS